MELNEIRNEIDKVDEQLVELYKRRMTLAANVAEYKRENNMPILDSSRERALVNKVSELSGEEFEEYTRTLYSTILDLSRSYQHKILGNTTSLYASIEKAIENTPNIFPECASVACQGVEGAYSQVAAEKLFRLPTITYFSNFNAVFSAIEANMCKYGVLPIENSTAGSVKQVYDLMKEHKFKIVRSVRVNIVEKNVQDNANNQTRFICITKDLEVYPGADKTSLMLVTPHKPGSLYKILSRFNSLGINLLKLESRHIPDSNFEFMFYFDLEASVYSDKLAQLLSELEQVCEDFTYLGTYSEVV